MTTTALGLRRLIMPIIAMGLVITLSNELVNHPLNYVLSLGAHDINLADLLTWGAFSYPICFLVTDSTNRIYGAKAARKVVYVGFIVGVALSIMFVDWRTGLASGSAFLVAQLLDIAIFDRLRSMSWWKAPVISSFLSSIIDTAIFFTLAFAGSGLPWVNWAIGDFVAKLAMIALLLYPFKLMVRLYPAHRQSSIA
jgi:uncharacterized PurR-regulated membrane protein YhhQ (DUF165 family)